MNPAIELAERGLLPDALLRQGIRSLLRRRLRRERARQGAEPLAAAVVRFGDGPLALHTESANLQHYEVPPPFFERVLGHRLKYSSCLFAPGDDLNAAEDRMLATCIERAQLADGQRILELGCGWGSLTLAMARRFPRARITAVSNSAPQRRFIQARAAAEGLSQEQVTVVTADLVDFAPEGRHDRIVSVECFEHMRNYRELLRRLASWLEPDGLCFIHVFCHRDLAYPFEEERGDDWMARHFFSGGTMPSFDLLPAFDQHLRCRQRWAVDGTHYARTARHWLERLDRQRDAVLALLTADLGPVAAKRQFRRWRLFFLACEECFGFADGREWLVGHYLFEPVALAAQEAA